MNKKIKEQWLAALRSGKYKQGKRWLRSKDNKYCCLGVLCDIVDPDGWKWINDSHIYFHGGYGSGMPGKNVLNVAGLQVEDMNPNDSAGGTWNILPSLNDGGKSFEEIADYIEEHL